VQNSDLGHRGQHPVRDGLSHPTWRAALLMVGVVVVIVVLSIAPLIG
jgi:hypothetical protein